MTLGGRRFLLSLAILAASVCLALGVSLPVIKLTKFVFFTQEHSLISTVRQLLTSGQLFLGLTVLVFSIVLPALKLFYLLLLATLPLEELRRLGRQLKALEWLGKWSMHDVLVLALTIFFIKTQGVWDARSLNGVYFFTAAVVLMILSYAWLRADVLQPVEPAKRPAPEPVAGPFSPPHARDGAARSDVQRARPGERNPEPEPPTEARGAISALRNVVLSFLIILATVFFALGIILPAIRFTTVYVWKNEHSIATIIWALYTSQEYFLCTIIFAFSILFPFLKLFYLLTLVTSPDMPHAFRQRSISIMEWLGRYSMTDVMVLALIIFYVNSSGYTEARVEPGIWFFAASALMTMFAYGWANSVAPRQPVRQPPPQALAPEAPQTPTPPPAPQRRARPSRA
ncbi:MAG: hypothetical protein RL291_1390 [Pseudomonadota bacterium]